MVEEVPTVAQRKLIDGGNQNAMAPNCRNIATIGDEIEPIGDRSSIDHFGRECGRSVTPDIAQTLGPHMTGLQREPTTAAVVEFGLKSFVIDRSLVLRRQNATPIEIRARTRVRGNSAGLNLIQVNGLAHTVGVSADIADAQARIGNQLPFDGQVPLC